MLSERTSNALAGISKATLHKGVRVKHLFRIMTHCPDLWFTAYAKIAANKGALTAGVDENNTLDGMGRERIDRLIESLKCDGYEPRPVRRVYIPKANGKKRPLGVPTGDDKMVQEVVRILLEGIYEPVFSQSSHGFRPRRSCHTALTQVKEQWKAMKWVVDMDIQGFYDNIDHEILINVLRKKIDDDRFIGLIKKLLRAGYLEDWKFHGTYSGTPQGGICSPVLANILLHELDEFVAQKIAAFNRGERRRTNLEYGRLEQKLKRHRKKLRRTQSTGGMFPLFQQIDREEIRSLEDQLKTLPSRDPHDEGYRRLHYVRYADDFVLGVIGTLEEARQMKLEVTEFLKTSLRLNVAEEKSGIRHIKDGFTFLGYHIRLNVMNGILKRSRSGVNAAGKSVFGTRRSVTCQLGLQIPKDRIQAFCRRKGYIRGDRKPTGRPALRHLSDFEIISTFNAEMRGFCNYYCLAPVSQLSTIRWYGMTSLFKTLGMRHKTLKMNIIRKMRVGTEYVYKYKLRGEEKSLRVYQPKHRSESLKPEHVDVERRTFTWGARTELLARLNAEKCESCETTSGPFEVHHIRKVKDLLAKPNKTKWEVMMCARKRKTLVLCRSCHRQLHAGRLPSKPNGSGQ